MAVPKIYYSCESDSLWNFVEMVFFTVQRNMKKHNEHSHASTNYKKEHKTENPQKPRINM